MKFPINKIQRNILIGSIVLAGTNLVHAQTNPADTLLNRTVIVEQDYNPIIVDAQKINAVPKVQEITVPPRDVVYDSKLSPATRFPIETVGIFAAKEVQPDAARGFVRMGYGMYGNLDARANYLFTPTENDKINIFFGMDGRKGKLRMFDSDQKWKNHYYRTRAQVDYTHQFNTIDLNIGGNIGLSNFNNNPMSPSRQKRFTSGMGHLGVTSTSDEFPVQFSAETNLMLYSRQYNYIHTGAIKETLIRSKANVTGVISDEQIISLGLAMNNRFISYNDYDNYTSILLNPYYKFTADNLKLRLGANADLAFGFGNKLRFSPDVAVDYIFADSYILYAKATGGRMMNDFRTLEMHNPHAELFTPQLKDSYERVNALAGFKASPLIGLWFNLYGGYQNIKDDIFCEVDLTDPAIAPIIYNTTNTGNSFVGGDVNYDYKELFGIELNLKYQNWDADNELAYMLKPELTFGGELNLKPIKQLGINLGYQYIQRTKVGNNKRPDAVSNLNASANYELFENISIYARATNLLNNKHSYFLNYMDQGISFIGGMSFRF